MVQTRGTPLPGHTEYGVNPETVSQILLVEDNPGDVLLAKEAMSEVRGDQQMMVARNGQEAMLALRCEGGYANSPRPDLVILDLNLPLKSGREVLMEMKADPSLADIPVAVLTTSRFDQAVCLEYTAGRCTYYHKPQSFQDLVEIMRSILDFGGACRVA
jgi:two-component system, chemotaxis family, response regulator Rcp1